MSVKIIEWGMTMIAGLVYSSAMGLVYAGSLTELFTFVMEKMT